MVSQGDCENFHNILGIMNFMTEARFIKQKSVDMCTCVYMCVHRHPCLPSHANTQVKCIGTQGHTNILHTYTRVHLLMMYATVSSCAHTQTHARARTHMHHQIQTAAAAAAG